MSPAFAGSGSHSAEYPLLQYFDTPLKLTPTHAPAGRTMASLTRYLQSAFQEHCPAGWTCRSEVTLLPHLRDTLGYVPRVDVLMERVDRSRRLWIEFEISRADPVANHAKFATAHLFERRSDADAFVAMVSPHVSRGRRNLASNMIEVMRAIGMNAFQTTLFPGLSPLQVRSFNHLTAGSLPAGIVQIEAEIERALLVSEPLLHAGEQRIHFAGDLLDVILNVRRWNAEVDTEAGRRQWGKRVVSYFVFDPVQRLFAPSKFCAYLALGSSANGLPEKPTPGLVRSGMTLDLYTALNGTDRRLDGHRARTHLQDNLALRLVPLLDGTDLKATFDAWLHTREDLVAVHPSGASLLLPPAWF